MLTTSLPIYIFINVSGLRGSHTSYLHSFSLKSPSTQTSSYHQFYSFIMEKSSNHQLLNGKISISSFPKFSISTAFKAQIHQIITKFKPILQSTGNPKLPLVAVKPRLGSAKCQYSSHMTKGQSSRIRRWILCDFM